MKLLETIALFCILSKSTWAHGGHDGGDVPKPLEFSSEMHNKEHILEHLQKVIDTKPKEELTDEELEFHYFKLHDYDNNNKLDGVEIGKALTHFHDDSISQTLKGFSYTDDELENAIEGAMKDDLDGDGYVEYYEFSLSQQLARSANPHLAHGARGETKPPSWNPDEKIKPPGYDDNDNDPQILVPTEALRQSHGDNKPETQQEGQGQRLPDAPQIQSQQLETPQHQEREIHRNKPPVVLV